MLRELIRRTLTAEQRRTLRFAARKVRHLGRSRFCPVCGAHCAAFVTDPRTGRPDAGCPVCDSRERHRAIWPFLMEHTPLARGRFRVLHVAPEHSFEHRLRSFRNLEYTTVDLARTDVDVREDLTKLSFEDGRFDFVICNHVLEHIPDDAAAMREMHRVLGSGGFAEITVPGPDASLGFPVRLERTHEDPTLNTQDERRRRYGHPGHVRQYGKDVADRLGKAGFEVEVVEFGRDLNTEERTRRGVYDAYPIYWCQKPARDRPSMDASA